MFCPRCGLQTTDDLKYCRQCGANLRGVREAMMSRSPEEKFNWNKTWVSEMFLSQEEHERRRGITPEVKRLNEIKGGVITSLVGIGLIIFLRIFLGIVAQGESGNDAEIIRNVWLVGIIPFLIGVGLLINGFFISRRIVKLKEQQMQSAMPAVTMPTPLPAKTTDQLINDAATPAGYGVTENTTAHLPESVAAPPRRELS